MDILSTLVYVCSEKEKQMEQKRFTNMKSGEERRVSKLRDVNKKRQYDKAPATAKEINITKETSRCTQGQ